MRVPMRYDQILAIVALLSVSAAAQQAARPSATRVIGTHQIDRYGAIE